METILRNKRANFEYFVIDTFIAGVQLTGTEVKSIRDANASIAEAYCHIINDEVYVKNMHIAEYRLIKYTNHTPIRDRKLLLNRKEINKLIKLTKEKGLTIIPLSIKLSDSRYIKHEIGVCRGKKTYDKKNALKEKDIKKESDIKF